MHLHQILSQRTGFIRANDRDRSHRFTSMHLSYKVVGGKHTAHIQSQTQRDAHRKSFGDSYYDQGNSHHKIFQDNLCDSHIIVPAGYFICRDIMIKVLGYKNDKGGTCHGKTDLANQLGEAGKLYVQRCRFAALFRTLPCHFTDLGIISHAEYFHHSMPIDHRCSTHHFIGSISGFLIKIGFDDRLVYYRLSRKVRLVDLQGDGFYQLSISGNFLTRFKYHNIAYHDVLSGNLLNLAVTDHFDKCFLIDCVQ